MRYPLKRIYGVGHLHFVACSCYRRLPLLGTVRARDTFLKVLEDVQQLWILFVGEGERVSAESGVGGKAGKASGS
jgi:hypothetical protein